MMPLRRLDTCVYSYGSLPLFILTSRYPNLYHAVGLPDGNPNRQGTLVRSRAVSSTVTYIPLWGKRCLLKKEVGGW